MATPLLEPVGVSGETLFRIVTRRDAQPVEVRQARGGDGFLPLIVHGQFANPGPGWNESYSPAESAFMNLRGDRFMERVAAHAFDLAVERARTDARPPQLLFQHGTDPVIGKKPIGKLTRLERNGWYEAKLYDVSYVRELVDALRDERYATSYAPSPLAPIRGELRRRPPKSEHNPAGLAEWVLRSLGRIKEVSIVTFAPDPNTVVHTKPTAALAAA